MKTRRFVRFALLVLSLAAAGAPALARQRAPLTAMSFSIRYGTANDGDNRWPLRRDFLIDVMREQNADVVGLQEALDFQLDEIVPMTSCRRAYPLPMRDNSPTA